MNAACRIARKSGDVQVADPSRSPLLRLPMPSDFFRQSKNQQLLAPSAPDCAWSGSIAKDQRRRSRLEAECLAGFNQPAELSTYQRWNSVQTTRATAMSYVLLLRAFSARIFILGAFAIDDRVMRSCDSNAAGIKYFKYLRGLDSDDVTA
jgi:hypothetical protein